MTLSSKPSTSSNKIISLLASRKTALLLFMLLAMLLAIQTLRPEAPQLSLPPRIALLLLAVNLAACTWQQKKRLPADVIIIHLGCLLIISGSQLSSLGFIATINIHESDSSTTAYRWDLQKTVELGFDLVIKKIHRQYYPTAIKIGVLKNGVQTKLFETRTGDKFQFGSYSIDVTSIDPSEKDLSLLISQPHQKKFSYHTAHKNKIPANFPLDFQLIAYRTPVEKKVWVDLELLREGKPFATGSAAVNSPFVHNSLRFYHTSTGRDPSGLAFAGIQIVKDPGISVVYFGFFITVIGCIMLLRRRMRPRN